MKAGEEGRGADDADRGVAPPFTAARCAGAEVRDGLGGVS